MYGDTKARLQATLDEIEAAGLTKHERRLTSPQAAHISPTDGAGEALNFCANNYLGLADHPDVVAAARTALDEWGFGMASVRFICGTQEPAQASSSDALSDFLGTEDTILFSSCFDANGGVFETLFGARGRDHLRRAQPRLDHRRHPAVQGAARYRYQQRRHGRPRGAAAGRAGRAAAALIVTDGVFSMDGYIAPLDGICDLADELRRAGAWSTTPTRSGFVGDGGRGTPELFGVDGPGRHPHRHPRQGARRRLRRLRQRPRQEIVDLLRQRSRPYLFSNAVAPRSLPGSLKALEIARPPTEARARCGATPRCSGS